MSDFSQAREKINNYDTSNFYSTNNKQQGEILTHSFLLQPGNWQINGHWLEHNEQPIPVTGTSIVTWKQERWFTIATELIIGQETPRKVSGKYRGHLDLNNKYYTYVLKHDVLGNIEGEGWIGPQAIVQYYWVLGRSQRHTGFDTYYRLNEDTYHFSGGMLTSLNLNSTMEATLQRQF